MAQRITTQCCDCKKVIFQGSTTIYGKDVSHGFCEACATKTMFLEGLTQAELEGFIYRVQELA